MRWASLNGCRDARSDALWVVLLLGAPTSWIDNNNVTVFDAVMPNLDILYAAASVSRLAACVQMTFGADISASIVYRRRYMGGNPFTELPFAIFKQGKLKDLYVCVCWLRADAGSASIHPLI